MALDRKLTALFSIFQDKDKNTVDVKDLSTILRSLGLVPSEVEAAKAVQAMVGEESADAVHLGAFLTGAKNLVLERNYVDGRYPGCSKGELVGALEVLAREGRSHLQVMQQQQQEVAEPESSVPSFGDGASKIVPAGSLSRSVLVALLSVQGEPLSVAECEELIASLPRQEGLDGAVDIEQYAAMLEPASPFL
ncbi:EF-hand domain pair [Trinorchestia longiramus]|nr:EF-hand domain pair [Trinorchestia longiramus]